jgi:hypothetical protein
LSEQKPECGRPYRRGGRSVSVVSVCSDRCAPDTSPLDEVGSPFGLRWWSHAPLLPPERASRPINPQLMRKPIRPADRLAQPRQSRCLLRVAAAAPLAASQTGHTCVGWSLPHRSRRAVVAKYAISGVDGSCKRSSVRRETCRSRASESMINFDLSRPPRRLWHVYYRGCHKLRLYR